MATIDLKLKSYDELIFEITRLNTDKYLLEQKVDRLNNIINELEKWLEDDDEYAMVNFECGRCFNYKDVVNKIYKLKELKEVKNNAE